MENQDAAPSRTEPEDTLDALRHIESLDVDLGLSRAAGQVPLYMSLLRKFASGQDDAIHRIYDALAMMDAASAERIAHTLRGVAGNLGATRLQHSAARLEAAIRRGEPNVMINALCAEALHLLAALIHAIRAIPGLLAPEAALITLTTNDRVNAMRLLQQIEAHLMVDDLEAIDLWETHALLLRATCPWAAQMEDALANFEFDRALQLLQLPAQR